VLSFRGGFGACSADNLTYIVSTIWGISLGTASFILCTTIILFLTIYFRNLKFLFLFFQVILFSPILDLWDLVILAHFTPSGILLYVTAALAILLMPLGSTILIRSTLPAGVYDELMFFTAKVTKFRLPVARFLNEMVLVALALILSFSSQNGWGSVRIGTFVFAVTFGLLIKFYSYLFDKIKTRRENHGNQQVN
jgi:uncharacterized membrane protein YczE